MGTYSTNEFKNGLKIIIEGDPCNIVENEVVKPGKGQAFNRVRLKNLKTGRAWEKTFKSGESVEAADVMETTMEYLYCDDEFWYFMGPDTFDQVPASAAAIEDAKPFLKEQERCIITLWNGAPLTVTLPNFVEIAVGETDPGLKGDTAQGATKPATLVTGAVVSVPLFIDKDEVLKIDTRTGEYVSRA